MSRRDMLFGRDKSVGGGGGPGGGRDSPGRGDDALGEPDARRGAESELKASLRSSLEEPVHAAGRAWDGVGGGQVDAAQVGRQLNQHRRRVSVVGDDSLQFEEMDPSERYGRFGEELGRGACSLVSYSKFLLII